MKKLLGQSGCGDRRDVGQAYDQQWAVVGIVKELNGVATVSGFYLWPFMKNCKVL